MPGNPNQRILDALGLEDHSPSLTTTESEARLVAAIKKAALDQEVERLAVVAERDRLQAIVNRLPKTADGVPVVTGDCIYRPDGVWYILPGVSASDQLVAVEDSDGTYICDCYSTREAAEAAAKDGGHE